jgi:hypothetical protein
VRLPETVLTAVPFMIDVKIDCPPPGEPSPPPECHGTMGIWFETDEKSAKAPSGFVTIFPFSLVKAGPFTFHKPAGHEVNIFTLSREFPGEIILVGQIRFDVLPPGQAKKK